MNCQRCEKNTDEFYFINIGCLGGEESELQLCSNCKDELYETLEVFAKGDFLKIQEQLVIDEAIGLRLQFFESGAKDAPYRLKIFGNIPHGNREYLFDKNGNFGGAGTSFTSDANSHLKLVEEKERAVE